MNAECVNSFANSENNKYALRDELFWLQMRGGVPRGSEKWSLDRATAKKSCAHKPALSERALLMDRRLWWVGTNDAGRLWVGNGLLVAADAAVENADGAGRAVGSL